MKIRALNLSLALMLAAAVSATHAEAQQGNGRGSSKKEARAQQSEARERSHDRRDGDGRYDDFRLERRDGKRVPPGWCQGRGNPHNTPENCGYSRDGRYDDRYGRSDSRYSRGGSYEQRHADFHAQHDRWCRDRAAQRPLDLRWQLEVRTECKRIHDDWHRREGIAHRY
jgi:hypothetical protein